MKIHYYVHELLFNINFIKFHFKDHTFTYITIPALCMNIEIIGYIKMTLYTLGILWSEVLRKTTGTGIKYLQEHCQNKLRVCKVSKIFS